MTLELQLTEADNGERQRGLAPVSGLGVTVKYKTIVADPPWNLEMGKSRTMNGDVKRGKWNDPVQNNVNIADLEYPTMSVEEICALQVPADDDAHCYIWTINRYIEQTYAVARAWGFEPSTMLYWLKQPMGLGLGGAFVPCVEPILFCRRGKLPVKRRMDRNWWGWPRGKHSAKPEEFQTVVESVSPGPYLEMFARRKRHGWHSWGNEVSNDVNLVTPNGLPEPSRHDDARKTK
jgi:N6-adenosine-specific RNA methylase IME4